MKSDYSTIQIRDYVIFPYKDSVIIKIKWLADIGFGELELEYYYYTKKWEFDTEYMSKEFVSAVIDKLKDKILTQLEE